MRPRINPVSRTVLRAVISRVISGCALLFLSGLALTVRDGAAQNFQVTDIFGRTLNQSGITLVDWDGYMANPAIKLKVQAPGAPKYPVNATISANGPRLYFQFPSTTSPGGPSIILPFATASSVAELIVSIFPDRDGADEDYTLTLSNGPNKTAVPIHVIDQDRLGTNLFNVTVDFSKDETGFFNDPQKRAIVQQAADDWAYFIDDMKLASVPAGAEQTWIWNTNGFVTGSYVQNTRDYTGYLLYAYGIHSDALRSGGEASFGGGFQRSDGVALGIRRSGGFEAETAGNYNSLGWLLVQNDNDWAVTGNLGNETNDFYSIAHHEIGHALFFNTAHTTFQQFKNAGQISTPEILAYHGGPAHIDPSDHFNGEIDDASLKGAFGYEYYGGVPRKRWLITKLDLLSARALGYVLKPVSALTPFNINSTRFVPNGVVGRPYNSGIMPTGGIPAYFFKVAQGTLPSGIELDSFSGAISGTPQAPGEYSFTIGARDNTANGPTVSVPLKLKISSAIEFRFIPSTTISSNDTFCATIEGVLEKTTVLESTSDFRNWLAIATNDAPNDIVQFEIRRDQPQSFFRARSIP